MSKIKINSRIADLGATRQSLFKATRAFYRSILSRRSTACCLGVALACGIVGESTSAQAQYTVPGPGMPVRPAGPIVPIPPAKPVVPQITTHESLVQLASGHPVCLVIGEGLASSFVGTNTVDEGPFQDTVMGAQVRGMQKTKARTSIDFTPDPAAARMLFVLKGITHNDTLAQVQRATVHSAGTFEFEMTKQIEFNGQGIRTWSPSAFLTIRQQNLGAQTSVSNVPLLGPLANSIVLNAAEQRKPISEGIAAHRVTQQVAPQFNSNLDQELAKLNEQLHGSWKSSMVQRGMLPSRISTLTTQDAMLCGLDFQAPLAESADASGVQPLTSRGRAPTVLVTRHLVPQLDSQIGFDSLLQAPTPYSLDAKTLRDRACLLIHTSLIENLVDRFHLAGREIPDTQLMKVLGTPSTGSTATGPQLYTLLLAKEKPMTASVDEGEIILAVRVGFRPIVGPELPTQVIKIAIKPTLTEDQILLKPEVRSIEPFVAGEKGQLGSAGTTVIRQALEQRLKEFSFRRNFELSRKSDRPSFPVRFQNLTLVDGWITLTIEQPPAPRSADSDAAADQTEELR